jgi:hypothetical protein
MVRRRSSKDHIRAKIVLASKAVTASSAGITRLKSDTVADLEVLYFRANLDDCAGGFVAENHGVFDDEFTD